MIGKSGDRFSEKVMLKKDDDLAEYLSTFQPRQTALEFGERYFSVDDRSETGRHPSAFC